MLNKKAGIMVIIMKANKMVLVIFKASSFCPFSLRCITSGITTEVVHPVTNMEIEVTIERIKKYISVSSDVPK
jgi:hypothetical protein